jgi:hypothetical protein
VTGPTRAATIERRKTHIDGRRCDAAPGASQSSVDLSTAGLEARRGHLRVKAAWVELSGATRDPFHVG